MDGLASPPHHPEEKPIDGQQYQYCTGLRTENRNLGERNFLYAGKEEAEETSVETDSHLFKRMEQIIKEEKLFLNPDLNRQDILNRLPIDKNRFAKIMQENSQTTLPQYLSNLRIKYAINQLKEHPNYTIQAIADESGFSNLRSFQRIFKAKTGMTPLNIKRPLSKRFLRNRLKQ